MALSPYFRSPFTDLTGNLITHQWFGQCGDFEMKFMECLEAYGKERGLEKCTAYMNDFRECTTRELQSKRTLAMRLERHRQHLAGERTAENKYAPSPTPDSY